MSKPIFRIGPDALYKGPAYYTGGESEYGAQRANSRTHKRFLRKHHLGKFKKNRAK